MTSKNAYIKNTHRNIYLTILIISIINAALSAVILFEKTQYEVQQEGICSAITGSNGCEVVQTSRYGRTLGIDNPVYGIMGFVMLGIFASLLMYGKIQAINSNILKIIKYLTVTGGMISGITAAIFLYLQEFVLHKYCIFCVAVDILSLILLGIAIYIIYYDIKHK